MMRAMYSAATGMAAQQLQVDTIANNIANVNTAGFKRSRVDFQDLMYQTIRIAGGASSEVTQVPVGIQVGHGVRPVAVPKMFTPGTPKITERPLDLLIDGDGFFQVTLPNGEIAYTRDGSLKVDNSGQLTNSDGYLLEPSITLPTEVTEVAVSPVGEVQVKTPDSSEFTSVGQITLARFVNPSGLTALGHNLMTESPASGTPTEGNPAESGLGSIQSGVLEMSNVKVIDEMVDLITAQRAYDVNSKSIQTSDEMLGVANNLKR